MNASAEMQVRTALDYASGTAVRNGATVDMQGYAGILMIVKFATIAASGVNSIKAQSGALANMNDAADLLGTKITVAIDDDDQIFMIDLFRPLERYVRLVMTKDTSNACAESAIYVLYGAKDKPVVQTLADNVTYELHVSPAEGTA